MIIQRPSSVVPDNYQHTVNLFWPEIEQSGEFAIYGGISWPTGEEGLAIDDVYGFAVLLGMDVQTRIYYVFEECRFETVEPVVDNETKSIIPGCANWFGQCWTSYMARSFYHEHPELLHMRYAKRVFDCEMIQPKPWFVRINKDSDRQWIQSIFEMVGPGFLKYPENTKLVEELKLLEVRMSLSPATKALAAALIGSQRNPWRRRQ